MSKAEQARAWALSRVGCPYVMGGTGKTCTVSYREARAAQYPQYADKIRKNCPRLDKNASTCKGCKWVDAQGTGKRCYDCAQLVRWCMDSIGITMVSGANSQWTKTAWAQTGPIETIPRDRLCIVYREDADGKKHHTGIYLGDGTIVHAKGHDYGVVREPLGGPRFTHWAIPEGLYTEAELAESVAKPHENVSGGAEMAENDAKNVANAGKDFRWPSMCKGATGAYIYIMQAALCIAGKTVLIDGKFGTKTEAALKEYQAVRGINVTGTCGSETWAALLGLDTQLPAEPSLDAAALAVIRDALEVARKGINDLQEAYNHA